MKRAIVWFTKDLRLHDNAVLHEAVKHYDEVFPLYCLDEEYLNSSNYGFAKTGKFRKKFLLESLQNLRDNVRSLGSDLFLLKGNPEVLISEFAVKHKVEKVFTMDQIAPEEKELLHKVRAALQFVGCSVEAVPNQALFLEKDLPFSVLQTPDVFTGFRNKVESKSTVKPICISPIKINTPLVEDSQTAWDILGKNEDECIVDSRAVLPFKGGESEGLKRLKYYLEESHAIETYKITRNGLVGELYSTKFSPWLAMGCLSPRLIYHEIKKYEKKYIANESTYWVIFELLWREYFIWMMKKHPHHFFKVNGISKHQALHPKKDEVLLKQWIEGKTKSDFVNANMIELKLTGFMSNRGRQNVASYLCHDLNIDWRYGAAYFEQQLIDYDVSSNWCNWAYIAGVGNNPRGKSVFNVMKQADDYDKDKSYRKLWLAKP